MSSNNRSWPIMMVDLDGYSLNIKIVRWLPPPTNWFKCNTNGASRDNSDSSSVVFCIIESNENFAVAKGLSI